MDPLEQLRKDNNCLKEQIMFLLKYCLAATSWSPNHTSANNNKYQKGTLVWYEDYVYECLVANNSIPVNNEYYWHKINLGHLLAQEVPISTTPGPGIYSFVSPLVEENEVVSILQAAINQDGYLSAIDWETFNNKQDALPVGDSSQYLKGDLTLGTFPTFPSIPTKTSDLTNDGSDGTNPFITANVLTSTITDGDITHAPDGNAVFDALALKLNKNSSITGATKTKITYDSNGLVTSGADATTADITDSSNKRYVTDANLVVIGNTSGVNSGNETTSTLGATINGATNATPNDTDLLPTVESSVLKKITWTNVKTFLKTYFDTLYIGTSGVLSTTLSGLSASSGTFISSDTILIAFNKTKYLIDNIASIYATLASPTFTGTVTTPAIILSSETASRVAIIDTSKNIKSADTTTYPNLTELSYIKGLTSSAQSQITANAVNVITITTSISIDTDTTSGGYGQHGRHNKISNGANAINLTVQTSSNADFVASYEKIGSSTITFVAGSGATLVQLSGTALLSGAVGSKACLSRNGNTYYLQITNY